jgi:hypothetical protein
VKNKLSPYSLLNVSKLKKVLSFGTKGYLVDIGWFNSFNAKMPVDEYDEPIPWVTYSFIDFIKNRIKLSHRIFEFGSGNSTYFYAKRAMEVISVEHDKAWFDKIFSQKPINSELIFCELQTDGKYCRMPLNFPQKFHIIIIDGRDRENCCKQSLSALIADGVIILDDSERVQYQEAIAFIKEQGYKELSFTGISPGSFIYKSTSVFYRKENCLLI